VAGERSRAEYAAAALIVFGQYGGAAALAIFPRIIAWANVYGAMSQQTAKAVGAALVAVSVILFFVSWQEYSDNANAVAAANSMGFGMLTGGLEMTPTMPSSSKYALLFGFLALLSGGISLSYRPALRE
jgi:hypothetical protein